eukprot:Gb_04444 [translate_table: standard]
MVDKISYKCTKAPVVQTVSKYIGKRRGCMAEPMNKKCLQYTFEVVEAPVVHCISLNWVHNSLSWIPKVLVYREVIEGGINEKRTYIFPEK